VAVSVLLKLAKRYQIDVYQAITWNYSAAIILTWLFLHPHISTVPGSSAIIYIALGVLLPLLFLVIAASIRLTGIVRTDVAQRLSLFIPVLSAFTLFGETPDVIKLVGISVGFIAIICLIPWKQRNAVRRRSNYSWLYLVIIFVGMGVIDVLLKQVAKTSNLSTSLFIVFILAFLAAVIGLIYQVATKKMRFSWPHIPIGWILGIANFGNILFFIKAHQALANRPSYVFSSMDIGVIIVGASVGLAIFREKLSLINFAGIILGVLAILVNSFHDYLVHVFAAF
jgi:hypothetical protein